MSNKVTMDEIAEKLNISKSLVSRALSDSYGVSDEMRNKIKMTAINMGYKFKVKKSQRFSQIESVTMVVERHDLLDSGFWVKIINGIEKELNRKGISVFLSVIGNDDEDTIPVSIKQMKTDGVIYDLLSEMGLEIPRDVSIVGFDNVPNTEWVSPALSTVHIPKTSMGERAVELLMKRIENPDKSLELILVGTDLIKRESVRNLVDDKS